MMRPVGILAAAAAMVLLASGCSSSDSAARSGSNAPASRSGAAMVIDQDFPDPDVLKSGGTYYLYATNTSALNIQLATSKNLTKWTVTNTDALPSLPSWAEKGNTWAPDVSEPTAGRFVMYFVAREPKSGKQCIGMATSSAATAPFTSTQTKPMVCDTAQGGDIDPSTFTDTDGTRYLVWKNDGNCCGLETWLQIAKLSADGSRLAGPVTKLIDETLPWEGNLVEAPTLVHHGSNYVLLYSSNDYSGDDYAIGYATATSLLGPYKKHPTPLLSTASSKKRFRGPGGQDVVAGPGGRDYLVFHSWDPAYAYRGVSELPLTWKSDEPVVAP
jgi:arabinan endo-1,5-alpha-L-arabinosidase